MLDSGPKFEEYHLTKEAPCGELYDLYTEYKRFLCSFLIISKRAFVMGKKLQAPNLGYRFVCDPMKL